MIKQNISSMCIDITPSLPNNLYELPRQSSNRLSTREISEQRTRSDLSPISTNNSQQNRHVRHSAPHPRDGVEEALWNKTPWHLSWQRNSSLRLYQITYVILRVMPRYSAYIPNQITFRFDQTRLIMTMTRSFLHRLSIAEKV